MKINILLIDDEVVNNVVNGMILRKTNLAGVIDSVTNGQEAIRFLEDRIRNKRPLPDIIFLDINMPVMDGFAFINEIKTHPAIDHTHFKIVILSSSFDPRDKEHAQELGITRYLEKPLDIPVAIEIILS